MRRVFITGSSGYVGNVLVHALLAQGDVVTAYDLQPHHTQEGLTNLNFVQGDIRDREKLEEAIAHAQPSHVLHLAYLMDPQHDKAFEYDIDVDGSKALLELATVQSSVHQIILFSSTSVYGAHSNEIIWHTEEHLMRPLNYEYAKNKKIIEEFLPQLKSQKKIVIIRMCTAVGPSYYKKGGVVSSLSKSPMGIKLSGENTLVQFIHEDDVIALVSKILDDPTIEGVYNLAPDSYTTMNDLVKGLGKKALSIPFPVFYAGASIAWWLRLSSVAPPCVNLIRYGIVATPKKLMERYQYTFKYSSYASFMHAIEQRKENKTL